VAASLFSNLEAEKLRIREAVVQGWQLPQRDGIIPVMKSDRNEEPGTGGELVPLSVTYSSAGKARARLSDLVKVGKEGYIHGFICVRPPCGKASEAVHDKSTGKVLHDDKVVGRQLKKEPGDAGYSVAHIGEDGKKVKLGGQFATRGETASSVGLYHNAGVLHDHAEDPATKGHLADAKVALGDGRFSDAEKHLQAAEDSAAAAGDDLTASHADVLRTAVHDHPKPLNEPSAAEPEAPRDTIRGGDRVRDTRTAQDEMRQARTQAAANAISGSGSPKDIAHGLTDEQLDDVDKELAHRASVLGHAGEVSRGHQAVKDEVKQRDEAHEVVFRQNQVNQLGTAGKRQYQKTMTESHGNHRYAIERGHAADAAARSKPGKVVTPHDLKPGDRVTTSDNPSRIRVVRSQNAGIVNFEDGGRVMPQGMGSLKIRRAAADGAPEKVAGSDVIAGDAGPKA
jgi:hypothetical protein